MSCTPFQSTHYVPRIPKRYHMWGYNDKIHIKTTKIFQNPNFWTLLTFLIFLVVTKHRVQPSRVLTMSQGFQKGIICGGTMPKYESPHKGTPQICTPQICTPQICLSLYQHYTHIHFRPYILFPRCAHPYMNIITICTIAYICTIFLYLSLDSQLDMSNCIALQCLNCMYRPAQVRYIIPCHHNYQQSCIYCYVHTLVYYG